MPEHRILLTARHHACESMASFALEGFLDEVLSDSACGQWFRTATDLMVVPILDKDGVEDGDQGKNRRPHDHNRDYGGASIYPEIAALREIVPQWSEGKLKVALDFHCPARSGDWHEHIHFVEPECDPARNAWGAIQALATRIETMNTSPLPYSADRNLAFGQRWNVSDPNHTNFASWAMSFDEVALSATFEFPYANVNGVQVTPGKARQFGRVMAKAVRSYLDDDGKTA